MPSPIETAWPLVKFDSDEFRAAADCLNNRSDLLKSIARLKLPFEGISDSAVTSVEPQDSLIAKTTNRPLVIIDNIDCVLDSRTLHSYVEQFFKLWEAVRPEQDPFAKIASVLRVRPHAKRLPPEPPIAPDTADRLLFGFDWLIPACDRRDLFLDIRDDLAAIPRSQPVRRLRLVLYEVGAAFLQRFRRIGDPATERERRPE